MEQFYGPATNCYDLGKIGYTLNGYYLVERIELESRNDEVNVEVIYCKCQQPQQEFQKKGVVLLFSIRLKKNI